jgi:hypothetical protein
MQEANLLSEINNFVSIKKQCFIERLISFKDMRIKFIRENKTPYISPLNILNKPTRSNLPKFNLETVEKNQENKNTNRIGEKLFPNIKLKNVESHTHTTVDDIQNSNYRTERSLISNTETCIKSKPLNTMYIKNLKTNCFSKTHCKNDTSPQENSSEDSCNNNIKALSFVKLDKRLTPVQKNSDNFSILITKSVLLKKIDKSNLNNQTSSDFLKDETNLNIQSQESFPISYIKQGNLIEAPTIDCLAMDNFNRSFNPQYYFTPFLKNKHINMLKKNEKKLDFLINDECFYHSTEAESQAKSRLITMNSPIKIKQLKKERLKNLYFNVSKKNHLSLLKNIKSKKDSV